MKLDIGSGGASALEGYLGVDPYAPGAEIVANMWALPVKDNSVEAIYSSHSLEHISKHQVPGTLNEWKRVLMPGGELQLLVPDLDWCIRHFLSNPTTGWELDIIFGHQAHDGEYHKTGFNKAIIMKYLIDARFNVISCEFIRTHGQQTIEVRAVA